MKTKEEKVSGKKSKKSTDFTVLVPNMPVTGREKTSFYPTVICTGVVLNVLS